MARAPSGGGGSLPPKPPYIEAFECFTRGKGDQLEGLIAYGLFILSDYEWASAESEWPDEHKVREAYRRLLRDYEVAKTVGAARAILETHRTTLVREHEEKLLKGIFKQIEERVQLIAAQSSRRSFWRGVWEAATGAFVWSFILVAVFLILRLSGVDILHTFTRP